MLTSTLDLLTSTLDWAINVKPQACLFALNGHDGTLVSVGTSLTSMIRSTQGGSRRHSSGMPLRGLILLAVRENLESHSVLNSEKVEQYF